MRPDDLRRLLQRRPFRPFRLYVLESTVYEIRHLEQVLVGRSTITIELPDPDLPIPLGERSVIVALLHITKLELIPPTIIPSTNGG
jgi:hypothetical protein